jgi:hypothetical protein
MINFSLLLTAQSTVTVERLLKTALPAVIAALNESGYAVDDTPMSETVDERGWARQYRVEPGPATLLAATKKTDGGSVQFTLNGAKFGSAAGGLDRDPVLWMRLVVVGVQFRNSSAVVASVVDPDVPIVVANGS